MSTQAASAAGSGARTVVTVVSTDTYISSALTEPVTAKLPAGSEMTDGDAIRFECTGGSLMVIETEDGRTVGVVPGDGQAVVVYEPGDTGDDFWRFMLLANQPQTTVADASAMAAVTAAAMAAVTTTAVVDSVLVNADFAESATDAKFKTTATAYFRIGGVQYSKAAEDDLVFAAADTINNAATTGDYYGVWLLQCTGAGVISTKSPSSDQVYASEAAAIAAKPAVDAGNIELGYLTIQANTDAKFTCNTDDLTEDAAGFTFYEATEIDQYAAEIDAAIIDLNAAKTQIDKLVTDVTAAKTAIDAVVTKANSVLATLEKFGFHKAE